MDGRKSARWLDREKIIQSANDSLKDHVLEQRGTSTNKLIRGGALEDVTKPYLWRCAKPGTGMCAFWVADLPSCIAQWGDVGGLIIPQGPSYNIEWLLGSVKSMEYVLGKAQADRTSRFVPEAFAEFIKERMEENAEVRELFEDREPDGPWEYNDYYTYVDTIGDTEAVDVVFDWDVDVIWAWAALNKFCELLTAARNPK